MNDCICEHPAVNHIVDEDEDLAYLGSCTKCNCGEFEEAG